MHTKEGEVFTQIVLEIFRLNGLLLAEGDRITEPFGLSSARWKVLGAVAMSKMPLTVAQIAKEMGQTRQSVQRIADRMVEGRFFTWAENPAHKRAKLLQLSAFGRQVYQKLDSAQAPWANAAVKQLDLTELEHTLGVLHELVKHFEK
ncbi:regulatory protein MarR [[Leptolyngbya] sp. PCC 7376]|uniref:MarR family winged helix-turn-helix transcriptional regulator n=1 Tax=[Leptolyngbya] sp. PCC 7376 TaxID=111781 RepID=UPI00029ECE36|nr:MarR family transcriptional regulator [[Leptolyngbya] sp. PCC 7376]AFY36750.1 regulatory protein MarR [[Leptolyngbya] sp. PCC 7376]